MLAFVTIKQIDKKDYESEYFFIYTVRNMDSSIGSSWTVTPYFVTQDGTKVLGETSTFSYTP